MGPGGYAHGGNEKFQRQKAPRCFVPTANGSGLQVIDGLTALLDGEVTQVADK